MCMLALLFFWFSSQPFAAEHNYYNNLSIAQSALERGCYSSAVVFFKEAFECKTHPYFDDIESCIDVCNLTNACDESLISLMALLLSEKSVRVKRDTLANLVLQRDTTRSEYGRFLDSLLLIDQSCRPRKGVYSDKELQFRDSVDVAIWSCLSDFFTSEGYPSEEIIGMRLVAGDLWDGVTLLLRHAIQSDNGQEVVDHLNKWLDGETLPNTIYATLMDIVADNLKDERYRHCHTYMTIIGGRRFRPLLDYSEKTIRSINHNRLAIGMDSLHVTQKQFLHQTYCREKLRLVRRSTVEHLPSFLLENEKVKKRLIPIVFNPDIDCVK